MLLKQLRWAAFLCHFRESSMPMFLAEIQEAIMASYGLVRMQCILACLVGKQLIGGLAEGLDAESARGFGVAA
ncbi:hypothetical protein [Glutamicibacter sp. FBE19]|uniref:hypothetical protein n=1 Tax=Glutamicibacter sp. FBE19 TaxID=2761534 RepID=UPI0018968CDA|nr:hypothetical protein [Glutamicibacter sp. FBE19]MBF6672592.1 hypothetical protein [Glutamicibacter sp. FBE19]